MRRETWRGLPEIICAIVLLNLLPALVLWKGPQFRSWLLYALWLVLSTVLTGMCTCSSGVVIIRGQAKSFLAPWQAVVSMLVNVLVVCGVVWALPHLPE